MALLNIEQGYNTTLHNRSPYLINFGLSCLIGLEKAAAAPRDVPRDNKMFRILTSNYPYHHGNYEKQAAYPPKERENYGFTEYLAISRRASAHGGKACRTS
ncbi:TPA: hypothetical protein AABV90_001851 [Neisseria gonorrhoeae]